MSPINIVIDSNQYVLIIKEIQDLIAKFFKHLEQLIYLIISKSFILSKRILTSSSVTC